jgi:alpha-beta hydrolase superfamily lysophospholipase
MRSMQAVLIHGAGGGGWEWTLWRGVLEAHGIETHAPDLQPAAGGLAGTAWSDYVAQARDACSSLERPRALVGASLGGLLAAACAGFADALVLVNPLPPAPWAARLPAHEWPAVVPWGRHARLDSTRRALPDADEATALDAFRRWRDESGRVLREAHAGIPVGVPACPVLCIASAIDEDVPPALTAELASAWSASLLHVPSTSHVGPLLGRDATRVAAQAADWLKPHCTARAAAAGFSPG